MTMKIKKLITVSCAMLAGLMLSACTTTNVDSQWVNPDYQARKLTGKVMIIGVSRDDTVRRLFEDEMAAQLVAYALTATPSHTVVMNALVLDSTSNLLKAANDIGASTILSSVVVDRQHVERIVAEPMLMYGSDFNRWYGYYWPYAYSRVEVRSFERYTVNTSLTDVATGKIIWSGRTQTDSTDHVDREVKAFVKGVTKALISRGML
jgi:hypothetical protein